MSHYEVIVEAGTEGGSISLLGVRGDAGWKFLTWVNDWTPELIDEEPIEKQSDWATSWKAALHLLDRYRWQRFVPLVVHPAFREAVWTALQGRFDQADMENGRLKLWQAACLGDSSETPPINPGR